MSGDVNEFWGCKVTDTYMLLICDISTFCLASVSINIETAHFKRDHPTIRHLEHYTGIRNPCKSNCNIKGGVTKRGDGSVGKVITIARMRTEFDSQYPHKKEQTKTKGLEMTRWLRALSYSSSGPGSNSQHPSITPTSDTLT